MKQLEPPSDLRHQQSRQLELRQLGLQVLVVTAILSLRLLLKDNVDLVNEVDVLPLAKQHVDPSWIPGDWYLNQPASYRFLFESIFGRLISLWGFLATSIIGRLVCYGLVATGLVLIGRKLGLRFVMLLLAIEAFIIPESQGATADEWLVRALEAKALSYGCVLLAIWLMLEQRYRLMMALLGLATSFHVLVGGWTFLITLGWLSVSRKLHFRSLKAIRELGLLILIYAGTSIFAIKPVLAQLLTADGATRTATGAGDAISPAFIYVFLRLSHHLNPLSWHFDWWIRPVFHLLFLLGSMTLLRRWHRRSINQIDTQTASAELTQYLAHYRARSELFGFTLASLVPFGLGLLIAPFDTQGSLLQFYWFRVGDVMLPLTTALLLACVVQTSLVQTGLYRRWLARLPMILLIAVWCIQAATLPKQFAILRQFPSTNAELKGLYHWVRTQTPHNTTVVTSPTEFVDFTWIAERPTIAKYKMLPQTKAGILEWYDRLADLNGGSFPRPQPARTKDNRRLIRDTFTEGYLHLSTEQAAALMQKYSAAYFMTRHQHELQLPIAYRNSHYTLYSQAAAPATNIGNLGSMGTVTEPVPSPK